MINNLAKSLVLIHTVISVLGMSWAILVVIQGRDFGQLDPRKEGTEYPGEFFSEPTKWVLHASEIDKSHAALLQAKFNRDLTYTYVKPAIDRLRETEPNLASNHLYYRAELKRLQKGVGELEVKPYKDGGYSLDTPASELGKPLLEDKAYDNIKKSYEAYAADLKAIYTDAADLSDKIGKISNDSKKIVAEMTGTDETNKYTHPGLYQLIDLEFKAQTQLKTEIDEIKPHWSRAIQNAELYQSRRGSLEATLEKLKKKTPPPPPTPKVEKKVV